MKVVVLGRGLLGQEFERYGYDVFPKEKFYAPVFYNHTFTYQWTALKNYDVVINCIAKSNTRWCEDPKNFEEALWVNGKLPSLLSDLCNKNNNKYVHISTGCLYDKTHDVLNKEDDFVAAHCNYTLTKLIGEQRCNKERDLIIRPRLLFSEIPANNNLLCKIPKFESYVGDQVDSLTCASTIVEAVKALLEHKQVGIFNVANDGNASMSSIAKWCGIKSIRCTTIAKVRKEHGIYLVNNMMSLNKLKKFYQPESLEIAIKRCYNKLSEANNI